MSSNLPIILSVDKTVITYMSLLVKKDVKHIMVDLRDMSNTAIERLQSRLEDSSKQQNNGRQYRRQAKTWTYVEYPGTEIRFRVDIKESYNYQARQQHQKEHEDKYLREHNLERPVYDKKKRKWVPDYQATMGGFHEWEKANPNPTRDFDYSCIMVEFKYNQSSNLQISQDEIDTILIEEILFADNGSADEAEDSVQ